MKYLVLLLFLVGCAAKLPNWRVPSNDEVVKVHSTNSPRCIQLLVRLAGDKKFSHIVPPEMLREAGGKINYVKARQVDSLEFMYQEALRIKRLQNVDDGELYTLTKRYRNRMKGHPGNYVKKNFNVDYQQKFGVHYRAATNKTQFANYGEPELIESMEVAIYKNANPSDQNLIGKFTMAYKEDEGRWVARVPGDMEGKWYKFDITAKEGAESYYGEPIPRNFSMVDHTALKTSPTNGTAQVYYLPDASLRPKAPAAKSNPNIWEINIADVRPPDVAEKYWGTSEAIVRSKQMMEKISHYDGIEIMPPRNAVVFENIGNDTLYLHHWAYMGTDFGFSSRVGGIEGIVNLVDAMHANGKYIYIDHVYQHAANSYKPFEWMLNVPHKQYDITGCGNTLNMDPGTTIEQLTMQNFKRDLFLVGFDGSRQDLAGALPKKSFMNLRDTAQAGGKTISGEPYGFGGGWDIFGNKVIGDEWGPPANAKLWDAESRKTLRYCASNTCEADILKKHLSGGNPHPGDPYWKQISSDATTILETHDAGTAAEELVSAEQALLGEYRTLAQAQFFHATAQGEILTGPMQPSALRHADLNDTPVDYFNLPAHRAKFEKDWSFQLADFRRKYSAYFSWDWENTISENRRISYLAQPNENAYGIYFKEPPPGYKGQIPDEELLILHNTNGEAVTFDIPDGDWKVVVDTAGVAINLKDSLYPSPMIDYVVSGHASVALVRAK